MDGEKFVNILESLEAVFKGAGKLAQKMQVGVKHYDKFHTGNSLVDIVTEADLAVQEFLLSEMSKTNLTECHLIPEESTPLTEKFNKEGKYYLTIDPIDGTAEYARGGKNFSTIITFHDGKNLLYLFVHYPVTDITHKIINGKYILSGDFPLTSTTYTKKQILYYEGNPEKNLPAPVYSQLTSEGMVFQVLDRTRMDNDIINFLAFGIVGGIYKENPNVYDGLTEFFIARAKGQKTYLGNFEGGELDLANIGKRESGFYYKGFYLALS